MQRASYFKAISKVTSPLLLLADRFNDLLTVTENDLDGHVDHCLGFAAELAELDNDAAKTRARFISMQCSGTYTKEFFNANRESWGIPIFEEELLSYTDFKNGFLFTFRDHSTSWSDDVEARNWFYSSAEAKSVRQYQFWTFDNSFEEIVFETTGNYKSIMWGIVNDLQDYWALTSKIFSKSELTTFYDNFDEDVSGFDKEELFEILKTNPNF
ncbi:hypothetical protein [Parasegetibacter sp. NRK P23]|uniref:hypothetical protein n=1 Tax=Parasegetibacter sp. NRK P23 TaxID=2942999 RepID=UPI00204382CE|nr:hypothetical protein [Parasegetibacter sp. NRK P23]MCM5530633.1 hypothetical protein [Parasegetibacter sp. NRK P23]